MGTECIDTYSLSTLGVLLYHHLVVGVIGSGANMVPHARLRTVLPYTPADEENNVGERSALLTMEHRLRSQLHWAVV